MRIRARSGKVTIAKNALKATITGQGLAATIAWDGTINAEEIWTNRDYAYLGFNASEEIATIFHTPDASAISESVGNGLAFAYLDFGASEVVEAVPTVTQNTIDPVISSALVDWIHESRYVEVGENGLQLKTVWNYESAEQAIDSGRMTAVKAVTNDLGSVEEVTVSG